jgi:hypothetical protein
MESGDRPAEVLGRIARALERAGVPYMLTGSFAGAVHGTPRSTQDIDIVIAPTEAALRQLLDEFPETSYCVSRDAALTAFSKAEMFNVVDFETGWKVDFIFRKPRDFSQEEFERRAEMDVLGLRVFVATPEDLLIAKLEWAHPGESERQIRDAAGIVATQGPDLDTSYVDIWVDRLGLRAQWEAARSAVP